MQITAEHLGNPVPLEDEPKLMVEFARMVRERLPIAYLSEQMSGITCDFDLDDNTRVTLGMWRSDEGDRVFEAKLEDETTDWLGEDVIYQRERVYQVNLTEMTTYYEMEWESYNGRVSQERQAEDEDEEEPVFTTAHLAEIAWVLERIPKIDHAGDESA